jgi:hypothetical protein
MELAEHITDHVKEHSSQAPSGKSSYLLKHFLKEYASLQRYTILYVLEWSSPSMRFFTIINYQKVISTTPLLHLP